ncbi:DUF4403 family protein [Flaviaesturariibacter flavus]|uniref:DUF4403 family protein n=1 Tax=Flaviaesturariibacter flavus TaxID=2502780 RepID=A0A4R1BH50_9BACT|nr:DUF4403 family protein [Flaviaesturariibacter flavus]TCJ16533.1 DUF4403 family protein [Flaviaesturariibacter flavus]
MKRLFTVLGLLLTVGAAAQKPLTDSARRLLDSLPESDIDIPITINLRPLYAMAEKKVDTAFASPGWPAGWVQPDCGTRYKYHLRRSPLRFSATGTAFNLAFTGFYQIIGSSRACVNGTVVSPWTPECSCGIKESERRVVIGFGATFNVRPDLLLQTTIVRPEPQALDKCTVCFWGQDVTSTVIDGIRAKLDASKKELQDSFGRVNLRPFLQQAWNKLSTVYAIPGAGYFSLHPKRLRMENISAKNDLLNISIGISATPVVSLSRPAETASAVPDLSNTAHPGGFNIFLEAALQYDSLTQVLNTYMLHKRFDVSDGLFKKYIVVEGTRVTSDTTGNLRFELDFSGSFNGTAVFIGKPVYDAAKKTIEVAELAYDLQTKNLLLKTAKWLFSNKITTELKKYTSFPMQPYYDSASKTINDWLNREWTRGIRGSGSVSNLQITALYALPDALKIRTNCAGKLAVVVNEIAL